MTFKCSFNLFNADSVNSYLVASRNDFDYPLFNEVLEDIDHLFHVNWLMNVHDILNEFYLKATTATDTIAKINRLSKLASGGGIPLKDLFMAKSLMDNIGE